MKSIMQKEKECFYCKTTRYLEEHHIFGGANRKYSERYGLKVYLCNRDHNQSPFGVHFNAERMQELHELGQRKFMEHFNASLEDFRKIFGKNYL